MDLRPSAAFFCSGASGVLSGDSSSDAVERRVLGDCDCGGFNRGSKRSIVQAGKMEEAEDLRRKRLTRARQNQSDVIGLFVIADPGVHCQGDDLADLG